LNRAIVVVKQKVIMRQITTTFFFLLFASICYSQISEADTLAKNQQFKEAIKLYKKYLKKNETDSSAWFKLGKAFNDSEQYPEAVEAYQKAIDNNFYKVYTLLFIARAHALNENKEMMYAALDSGVANGAASAYNLENDKQFEKYRSEDRFQGLISTLKEAAFPCLKKERADQFDFWVGSWTVYAGGGKAGDSEITKAKGGCAVHESYTTAREYSGQSINFLNPQDNLWKQYWVGSRGDVYNYSEIDAAEGMLQFLAEFDNNGTKTLSRLTFTYNEKDDTVTQLFENSTDDGESWQAVFNGLYVRKK
jgi:tetratricopeptide (TPR) repeat protein